MSMTRTRNAHVPYACARCECGGEGACARARVDTSMRFANASGNAGGVGGEGRDACRAGVAHHLGRLFLVLLCVCVCVCIIHILYTLIYEYKCAFIKHTHTHTHTHGSGQECHDGRVAGHEPHAVLVPCSSFIYPLSHLVLACLAWSPIDSQPPAVAKVCDGFLSVPSPHTHGYAWTDRYLFSWQFLLAPMGSYQGLPPEHLRRGLCQP